MTKERRGKTAGLMAVLLTGVLMIGGCQSDGAELDTDDITISKYKDVEIEAVDEYEEITDDDVDAYIEEQLYAETEYKDIEEDRAAEEGDTVNIDYKGYIDGEELENGAEEGAQLTIGEGAYIDGFEESIIGHKKGDTYDWNGKFPDDYAAEDVAGKDVTFTMTLNGIVEEVTPELDDAYVQSVSDTATTVEEYKDEIREYLINRDQIYYKLEVADEAWSVVLNNSEVKKYPEGSVQEMLDLIDEEYSTMAQLYGTDLDDFVVTYMGYDSVDAYNAAAEEAAEESVKQELAVDAIAEKEDLTVTDDNYDELMEEIILYYGYPDVETLEEDADEETLDQTAKQFLVKDWVGDHCIQVEGY